MPHTQRMQFKGRDGPSEAKDYTLHGYTWELLQHPEVAARQLKTVESSHEYPNTTVLRTCKRHLRSKHQPKSGQNKIVTLVHWGSSSNIFPKHFVIHSFTWYFPEISKTFFHDQVILRHPNSILTICSMISKNIEPSTPCWHSCRNS